LENYLVSVDVELFLGSMFTSSVRGTDLRVVVLEKPVSYYLVFFPVSMVVLPTTIETAEIQF
jgi:hypothetical protein